MSLSLNDVYAAKAPLPDVKPEVGVMTETQTDVQQESHVYVHCYFNNTFQDMLIRIWRSTFLVDNATGTRSPLVHVENISYAPQWTLIPDRKLFHFLLIFEALPKNCVSFNLIEDIPQPGGFRVENISRNKTDVYHIDI
jgi:hypothetical protein